MSDLKGIHHFYLGIIACLASFVWSLVHPGWGPNALLVLGFLIMLDDYIQHQIRFKKPEYTSPLHRLYVATLYRIPAIQKLNQWADELFGG